MRETRSDDNRKRKAPMSERVSDTPDEEDAEIARLEKLLGINSKKDRKKSASKLNKEYEKFEVEININMLAI